MITENERGQEKPEEGATAGREGNEFRRSYGGQERTRYDQPYRQRGNDARSFDRPRRNYNSEDRSYGDGGERRYRSYGQDGEERGGYRPRRPYNNEGGERSFDRPRRPYNNNDGEASSGNRFYQNNHGEQRFERRPYRPFNHQDGEEKGEFRPRRPYNNECGEHSFDRPRRPQGGYNRGQGGYSRPRPNFAEEPAKDYGNRPDGRPRRPRIKKNSEGTAWLAENEFKTPRYAPNLDPTTPIRLNKFLSNAGICSRREADEYIQAGVVKVNGEMVCELGVKVLPSDEIMFHDQPVKIERKVYILLNKPKDCVTTSEDPQERLTVMDLVKNACYERIYPVGRLDRNTTGVLLLTNDGDLASKLAHPKYEKRKIYQATLDKDLTEEDMAKISEGVELDGEHVAVDEISYVNEKKNVIGIEIHSGQNRVVRRIFEQFGYRVYKLDRVYFAGLTKKNLPRGKWRHLTDREVSLLKMGVFA